MKKVDIAASRLRQELLPDYPDIAPLRPVEDPEDVPADTPPTRVLLRRTELRPSLFGYQRDLADQMLQRARTRTQALLSLPTGAGKTRTAVVAILDALADQALRRVVWLAPTLELLEQAFSTFETMWSQHGTAPDIVLTRKELQGSPLEPSVWLTTPQTVYSRSRLGRPPGPFDFIVFDEAHQLGARTFRDAVRHLSEHTQSSAIPLLGLSATPGRLTQEETEDLVSLFNRQLMTSRQLKPNPVRVLQRRGVLARLEFKRIPDGNNLRQAEPHRLKLTSYLCRDLVAKNKKVLVFAHSVAGAIVLAEALQSVGIAARPIHGNLSRSARAATLRGFATGDIRVITNQRLLATGYDCPAVSDVVCAATIGSPIQFEQIIGRAARGPRTGGSAKATIWDFDNHLELHGLPKSYYRFKDFDWTQS